MAKDDATNNKINRGHIKYVVLDTHSDASSKVSLAHSGCVDAGERPPEVPASHKLSPYLGSPGSVVGGPTLARP